MGELVDRIAKAMRATSGGQPFSWENAARAALRECETPTERMVEAGERIYNDNEYHMSAHHCAIETFRAMIKSELDEG